MTHRYAAVWLLNVVFAALSSLTGCNTTDSPVNKTTDSTDSDTPSPTATDDTGTQRIDSQPADTTSPADTATTTAVLDSDTESPDAVALFTGSGITAVSAFPYVSPLPISRCFVTLDRADNIIAASSSNQGEFDETKDDPPPGLILSLRKYRTDGTLQWSIDNTVADGRYSEPLTDADNNIYTTVAFDGTLQFGSQEVRSSTLNDGYLLKISPEGTLLKSVRFYQGVNSSFNFKTAIDSNGVIYVAGIARDVAIINDTPLYLFDTRSLLVATYTTNLEALDLWQFDQSHGYTNVTDFAIAPDNTLLLAGHGMGNLHIGETILGGSEDDFVFVSKLSSLGAPIWTRRFDMTSNAWINQITINDTGDIYLTGTFTGTINPGGGLLQSTSDYDDIFIAKLNAAGAHQWSRSMGSDRFDHGLATVLDAQGNLIVGGSYSGSVDFGGTISTSQSTRYGDGFVAGYAPDGALLWQVGFGLAEDSTYVESLLLSSKKQLLVHGTMPRQLQLGNISLDSPPDENTYFISLFNIDPVGEPVPSDWQPNPGDIAETIVQPLTPDTLFDSVQTDACEEDPLARANANIEYCPFVCISEPSRVFVPPTGAMTLADICSASTDVVRLNSAATILLEGALDAWRDVYVHIAVAPELVDAIVEPPAISVPGATHFLAEAVSQTATTQVAPGQYQLSLGMPQSYPCHPAYQLAVVATTKIQCASTVKQVETTELFSWCPPDDSCKGRQWVDSHHSCYEVREMQCEILE